jgi:S-adenosylmethionine:tRNA ribosyltransferase-isomerase
VETSAFEYDLPREAIAQEPLEERDASRLMLLERSTGRVGHHGFRELPSLLSPGDLLVLNDTRVVPARLYGLRVKTGGRVEVLVLEHLEGARYRALTKSGGRLAVGERLRLAGGRARARIIERLGPDGDVLEIETAEPFRRLLETAGHMPVPPYVRRDPAAPPSELDRRRYQTIYAREEGAIAAPTAGLHFTERVFCDLERRGVETCRVTLHVGPGTFRPVKTDEVEQHSMDAEPYEISPEAAGAIASCRERRGRVVAVGTTAVRALESAAREGRLVREGPGRAEIFITPGYEFGVMDALVTNFHLPRGTPLLLVSAFAGRDRILAAYREALREGYRFLSYGDAMLII